MAFKFPFTNYHELNLTWVLDQLKKLFEESAENVSVIETYNGRLTAVETELPAVSENAAEAARSAAAAASLAQTAKATADTAQENAIQAQRAAGTAQNTAERAQEAADAATQAAQQAQATAQNFDGRITQAENDASQALEASRSFENRVQSAITTANNANQTATNAQGIAMRADQNAGAALDKIGDLSQLDTTAKQNLVVAINEALENGGKVDSVNGKTGVVVLDAGDIGYNGSTVESALNGKQNAPAVAGTAGQVLGLNSALEPVWLNQSGGAGDVNLYPLVTDTGSVIDVTPQTDIEAIVLTGDFPFIEGGYSAKTTQNRMFFYKSLGNLIDYNAIQWGYEIGASNYPSSAAQNRGVTGYIDVSEYDSLMWQFLGNWGSSVRIRCALYDANKVFLRNAYNEGHNSFNVLLEINTQDVSYINFTMLRGLSQYASLSPVNEAISVGFPENFYGGIVNYNTGVLTSLYDSTGELLETQIESLFDPVNIFTTKRLYCFNRLQGSNYDSVGTLTAKYRITPQQYTDKKIAELQALVLENNG